MGGNARKLRAIGQDLEDLPLTDFELHVKDGGYVLQGTVVKANPDSHPKGSPGLLDRLIRKNGRKKRAREEGIRKSYQPEKVDRLDKAGRKLRGSGKGEFEEWQLSHLLRVLGAFVDHQSASLMKLTRQKRSFTIVYQNASGETIDQRLSYSTLYDFATFLYHERKAGER
jgi:hypothetical protein